MESHIVAVVLLALCLLLGVIGGYGINFVMSRLVVIKSDRERETEGS